MRTKNDHSAVFAHRYVLPTIIKLSNDPATRLRLCTSLSLPQYTPGSLCFACSTTSSASSDPACPEHYLIDSHRLSTAALIQPPQSLSSLSPSKDELLIHQNHSIQYSDTSCIWILDLLFGASINTVISIFTNPPGEKKPIERVDDRHRLFDYDHPLAL